MIHWDDPLQRSSIRCDFSLWLVEWPFETLESPGGPGSEFIKQLILDYLVIIKLELEPTQPKIFQTQTQFLEF